MRRYGDTSPPTHDRKTVPEQVLAIVRLQRVSMAAAWRTYLRESPSAVARNMGIPLATYKKLEKQQTLTLQEAKRVGFELHRKTGLPVFFHFRLLCPGFMTR